MGMLEDANICSRQSSGWGMGHAAMTAVAGVQVSLKAGPRRLGHDPAFCHRRLDGEASLAQMRSGGSVRE
jgi:hypothetical protein